MHYGFSGGAARHSMSVSVGDATANRSLAANRHLQWKSQKVFIDRIYQVSTSPIITYYIPRYNQCKIIIMCFSYSITLLQMIFFALLILKKHCSLTLETSIMHR